MPSDITLLHSSTEALAASEDAVHMLEQKERIQRAVINEDPAQVLDTSKAFLETVFKTILQDREEGAEMPSTFTQLFRAVSNSMPMSQDAGVADSLGKMASSIVHHVGELRNAYGATSHGDDGYHACPVEMNDAHMVVQFVDGLAGFVLKKHRNSANPEIAARIHYNDHSDFNEYWDEQYEGYELPFSSTDKSVIPASELLFKTDLNGYREALLQFRASEEEDGEDEE
ncbi:MAG: abortive infection protein [Planctomycetota bacterium]|nr:MAG: abortive infection protein [Planctomycetota bacterium]